MKQILNWTRKQFGYPEAKDEEVAKVILDYVFSFTSDYILNEEKK